MARALIFDTGPIISLTTNNLLWILRELKKEFRGDFFITQKVKRELIDVPIEIKRFKFEALQILKCIDDGILAVLPEKQFRQQTRKLLEIANHSLRADGSWLKLCHPAELEVVAAAVSRNADAVVIDERTTRLLFENPAQLAALLERKLEHRIIPDKSNITELKKMTADLRFIRSTELALVAYERGILDSLVTSFPQARKHLLQGMLWGMKLRGCAIRVEEIDAAVNIELGK